MKSKNKSKKMQIIVKYRKLILNGFGQFDKFESERMDQTLTIQS